LVATMMLLVLTSKVQGVTATARPAKKASATEKQ